MGKRGPVTGSSYGHPSGRPSQKLPVELTPKPTQALPSVRVEPPPVPESLGPVGKAIWDDLWSGLVILSPKIDGSTVERYARAADDAADARSEISRRGLVLDEVLADPRGGIIGSRAALNPAVLALRNSERTMTELADRLGLSPSSRARLGLTISLAELASAEASRVLSTMFAPVDATATKAKRR